MNPATNICAKIGRTTISKHSFVITLIRDTDSSFLEITKRDDGKEISRKLEKGQTEYGNACRTFHMSDVPLVRHNAILISEVSVA